MTIETKELQQSLQRISGITHNINNKASNIDLKILRLTNNIDHLLVGIKKYIEEKLDLANYIQPTIPNSLSNLILYEYLKTCWFVAIINVYLDL